MTNKFKQKRDEKYKSPELQEQLACSGRYFCIL